jgi:hypothetical protein
MRSSILRKRSSFLTRPPRWKKRLLYSLAFFGAIALSGLTFMVYLALQVPEGQLNAGIPFPKLTNTVEKSEPIPVFNAAGTEKQPSVGGVPAFAFFYSPKSGGQDQSKLDSPHLRKRLKPAKRTPGAVKAKRSS